MALTSKMIIHALLLLRKIAKGTFLFSVKKVQLYLTRNLSLTNLFVFEEKACIFYTDRMEHDLFFSFR